MNKRLGPPPSFKGFVVGCLTASLIACGLQPVTAAVDDNLGSLGIKIADALGVGKENNIPGEDNFKEAEVACISAIKADENNINANSLAARLACIYISCLIFLKTFSKYYHKKAII